MLSIKSNEMLFRRWQRIGREISSIASIVQNDMEIEPRDFAEWKSFAQRKQAELHELFVETLMYVVRGE